MKKLTVNKLLLYWSFSTLIYFILLKIVNDFELDTIVIVGVFKELLTIPFLILLIVVFIALVIRCIKDKFTLKSTNLLSLLFITISIILMIKSIFYK
jgi:hypothetical protein